MSMPPPMHQRMPPPPTMHNTASPPSLHIPPPLSFPPPTSLRPPPSMGLAPPPPLISHLAPPPPNSSHSLAPPPPSAAPPSMPPPPEDEQPEAKRARIDGGVLVSEEDFFSEHSGTQTIAVIVPGKDDSTQTLQVEVSSVKETVLDLKNKLAALIGMPANKQKLASASGGIMRDNDTLAFYNAATGSILTLTAKERGGRKK
eukprot:CAMPEP_0196574326 /NCGR_PEP_ID=MMETSP1081-20130531/4064_1 /TAXON_ID=36882 /ORGANISM="Pyramimonas amylifera, Strain CCMP720" /LENGTH=200 /DNA_ID=CAMNT_0041892317 /DNA_START=24 /DNA_END=626 /DNA_ORIENTATION=+